nr:halocyanin [Haloarcula sp. CK38]
MTVAALALTALAIGAVYLFSWRDRPEPTFTPATPTEERVPPNQHTGQMYESDVAASETESVDHDAFDPVGTGTIIAIYFAVIALAWLFMYFVEFLGNGPTVVG